MRNLQATSSRRGQQMGTQAQTEGTGSMTSRRLNFQHRVLAGTIVGLCMMLASCSLVDGNNGDDDLAVQGTQQEAATTTEVEQPVTTAQPTTTVAPTTEAPGLTGRLPGEGVTINMARANWTTSYMQAEIYRALLKELGYTVGRPAELSPTDFYPKLAAGELDFWPSAWTISHTPILQGEFEGGTMADKVTFVGEEMLGGGLEGIIVDLPTATQFNITTLDDIATRPELAAIFDTNGNGIPDVAGCDEGWGCQAVLNNIISENGWEGQIEQISGTHGALFAEQAARFTNGKPVLSYVWTPGAFVTELVPSEDVYWLGVRNPAPEHSVPAPLPEDQCRFQPCTLGWSAQDIKVAANNDFLAANPPAARLLELVKIRVLDVNLQTVKMAAGEDTDEDIERHAAEWIEANRNEVGGWLWEAFNAA